MRQLLITIFILHSMQYFAFGQELKAKKEKSLVYLEEYTILAKNKKVKHGDYKKYRSDGSQVWTGKIDNNNRVGEWTFYESGEKVQTYNYDDKKMTFQKKPVSPYFVRIDNQIQILPVDTPPSYLGSKIGLTDELNKVLAYPMQARRMGVEGAVTVAIWINADNTLGKIELISGIMKECDQDLIAALKKIPQDWFAATIGDKKITSKLIIVVDYKLDNIFENAAVTVR
ncbi:MAG: energy transducer TonB [Cyclobacteriaceae bacterium]|jgi:hypothetical protein|nr:energy transducer TonB [Flammeovirgaceae bacterium]